MLRIAICDDDLIFSSILEQMIIRVTKASNRGVLITFFASEEQLTQFLQQSPHDLDILFLDVILGTKSGLDVGQMVRERNPLIQTIYMSADANYSLDVFDLEPVYFLHKPIDLDRLTRALDLAVRRIDERSKSHLRVGNRAHLFNIPFSDIFYIESERRILIIHRKGNPYRMYGQLDEIEKLVPEYFIRCHQSYLVNMNYIQAFVNNRFVMSNGRLIPIAQKRRSASRERFTEFVNTRK